MTLTNKRFGTGISIPNKLIRVRHILASKTELVGEDIFTGGLYESTIYLQIIYVGIGQSGDKRCV